MKRQAILPWIAALACLSTRSRSAQAFVLPTTRTVDFRTPSFSLHGWDQVVYETQAYSTNLLQDGLQSNLLGQLPVLYAAGLITSLSPCSWGILPMTFSYINAGQESSNNVMFSTVSFASGLALVFCTMGVVTAKLGGVLGAGTSVYLPLASYGICLVMGFKLLELIDIPLPSLELRNNLILNDSGEQPILIDGTGQILTRPTEPTSKQQHSLWRTFLLGGSTALVATPCATPVLTSILAHVAQTNELYGALILFCFTLGYTTPLLMVAATSGQLLKDLKNTSVSQISPWVTPVSGGILLYYGVNGLLTSVFGDPSIAGLPVLE